MRKHLWVAVGVAVVLVAAACTPSTSTVEGTQRISVTSTGRHVWSVDADVPSPGYRIGLADDGKVASLTGGFGFVNTDGDAMRVTLDVSRLDATLRGSITYTHIPSGDTLTALVDTPAMAPEATAGGTLVRVAGRTGNIYDGQLVPATVDVELHVDSSTTTSSTTSTTTTTTTPGGVLAIDSSAVGSATVGVGYSAQLSVVPEPVDVEWSYSGELPLGVSMDPAGLIEGTPTEAGSFTVEATATSPDAAGTATVTLVVSELEGPVPATFAVAEDPGDGETATMSVEVGADRPIATEFELDEQSSLSLLACAGDDTPATVTVSNAAGVVLGTSMASADAGCAEIDSAVHPEQAWAADVPAGTYQATLSYLSNPAALRAAAASTSGRLANLVTITRQAPQTPTTTPPNTTPIPVGVIQVSAGSNHSCALLRDRTVACWGANTYLRLGGGTSESSSDVPVAVPGLSGVVQVSAGSLHTCALLEDATVRCWGSNFLGRLGLGYGLDDAAIPTPVPNLSGVKQIEAGPGHSCALLQDTTVRCWGDGTDGELGHGSSWSLGGIETVLESPGVPLTGVTQISLGKHSTLNRPSHTCALLDDGRVKCWGDNYYGQLGGWSGPNSPWPVAVVGVSSATNIAVGPLRTCAVVDAGAVDCWGFGYSTMTRIAGVSQATQLTTGWAFSCALQRAGTVRCWGTLNRDGQLGDGTGVSDGTPVEAVGLAGVSEIATGESHSCAVAAESVKCWGQNQNGEVGDGTSRVNRLAPVSVVGLGSLVATEEFPGCGVGGSVGSPQEYYRSASGEVLRLLVQNTLLKARGVVNDELKSGELRELRDAYGGSANPSTVAWKAAVLGVVDFAVGQVPVVGPAYGAGSSVLGGVEDYQQAVRDLNERAFLTDQGEHLSGVLTELFPELDDDQAEGLAIVYLNEFVSKYRRCPTRAVTGSPPVDRLLANEQARWRTLIHEDMFQGEAAFTNRAVRSNPVAFDSVFVRQPVMPEGIAGPPVAGEYLQRSVREFFELNRRVRRDDGRAIRMGEPRRDADGERVPGAWTFFSQDDVYKVGAGTSAGTQLSARDVMEISFSDDTTDYPLGPNYGSTLRSGGIDKASWPNALRQLINGGGTGLDAALWQSFAPSVPSSRFVQRVVVVTDPRFKSLGRDFADNDRSNAASTPYFYVIGSGTPLAPPDLSRQMNQPGYRYPKV